MKKEFLECGRVVSTHGVRGELNLQPWCDAQELAEHIRTFYLDEGAVAHQATSVRSHKSMLILKLVGIETIEQANTLRGRVLWLRRQDLPLAEGEYFIQDLLGLEVRDADDGHLYGELCDVTHTGANDVYHIRFADGSLHLIPAIRQVVIETDIDAGVMKIRPLEGLFDAD